MKKTRKKILLKRFIELRENPQSHTKVLRFKKKKWENLQSSIIKKLHFTLYKRYLLKQLGYISPTWYTAKHKKTFKFNLLTKQKICYFYGNLKEKTIKKVVRTSINKNLFPNNILLKTLESRLDVVLYRCFFAISINTAQQFILHGGVYVNKKKVKSPSFEVKKGDFISVSRKLKKLIYKNLGLRKKFWPAPSKYFQIDYKLLIIILVEEPNHLWNIYPFFFDIKSLLNYYRV